MTAGRKPAHPSRFEATSIEATAYDELWHSPSTLTTADLEALLRARGFVPHNLSATLSKSKRIYALPRSHPTDRYRWYVDKRGTRLRDS